MAFLMAQALQPGYEEDLFAGEPFPGSVGLNSADESLPYSTAELNAPEYSTDDFRMFNFKVARCSKRFVHDWRACPFAHPTENARRRDPRLFKYLPVPCPEYKKGICFRGDDCPYSHGVYECWLHPSKYRTQLCKEGPQCRRPVCFFAHSVLDLRQPSHVWDGNGNEQQPSSGSAALLKATAGAATANNNNSNNGSGSGSSNGRGMGSGGGSGSESSLLMTSQGGQQSSEDEAQNNSGVDTGLMSCKENGGTSGGTSCQAGSAAGGRSSRGGSSGDEGSESPPPIEHADRAGSGTSTQGAGSVLASPSAALMSPSRQQASAQPSPTTPSRTASGGDNPARPSAEVGSGLPLPVAGPALSGADGADAASVASALAAAISQVQAQQQGARQPPRHSIDIGALSGSSRGQGLNGKVGGSGAHHASPHRPPRMSFDVPSSTAQQAHGASHRMSLDSAMQTKGGHGAAAWAQGPNGFAGSVQDMPGTNGPRMSNAVARKLGLAPQRNATESRMAKMRSSGSGMNTPSRASVDDILQALHSNRASMEQIHMNQQMLAAAGLAQLNGGAMLNSSAGYLGGGGPGGGFPHHMGAAAFGGGGTGGSLPSDPHAMAGINPALLSMVAAQMNGGVPLGPGGMTPQGGTPSMGALLDSLNGWNLNGAAGAGGAGGNLVAHHLQQAQQHAHRASFDGVLPPHQSAAFGLAHHHQQAMPPSTSPYFLPSELESMMNNHGMEVGAQQRAGDGGLQGFN